MKVIKIDSTNRTISNIEIGNSLDDIYAALGDGCTCFACPVVYPNNDGMYIDDEGLGQPNGFIFPNWLYPISGNALIIGTDSEGNSMDAQSTIEDFSNIKWFNFNQ